MKTVRFHAEARKELLESARYYESQQRGLGTRLLTAVREATHSIRAFPLLYRVLEGNIRQCKVPRFPYGLIYQLHPDEILIIAVMHLHRQPGYWRSRLQ